MWQAFSEFELLLCFTYIVKEIKRSIKFKKGVILMDKHWTAQLPVKDLKSITPVSGGDVNDTYRIETGNKLYFLLVQPGRAEDFYAAEIAGLRDFEKAEITAPRVEDYGQISGDAYLLLDFLEEGSGSQKDLGELVAKLHLTHQKDSQFGYHLPYEGSDITFQNGWFNTWSELFIDQRLVQLHEEIIKRDLWSEQENQIFISVLEIIKGELNKHDSKPSLLHGDLWSGNYMFLNDGRPALFDPSPLYGDREFDLGATQVFGGFGSEFYEAYDSVYPLAEGAERRIEFYKLYLLLVHLVKFGEMYLGSVSSTMRNIISKE